MILSIKKTYQSILFLVLGLMAAPMVHGSDGGSSSGGGSDLIPDIEEVPLGLHGVVRPKSSQESVEDFVAWSRSVRVNVVDRYSDDDPVEAQKRHSDDDPVEAQKRHSDDDPVEAQKRHVDFLKTHTSAPWYVVAFRPSFIPEDDGEYTYVQAMKVLLEAKQLGSALSQFTTNLFKLFEDEVIDSWDASFIEQKDTATSEERNATIRHMMLLIGSALSQFTTNLFKLFEDEVIDSWDASFIEQKDTATSEERNATIRHMMLLIQNMSMQSYVTFAELGVNKQPVDLEKGTEEDRKYQEALLEAHEAFADDCHFNPFLLAAQTDFPESALTYEAFLSSLFDTCARQALTFTGHALHSTAEELHLSDKECLSRLTLKADLLEKKTLLYLDFAARWFASLFPVYAEKAREAVMGKNDLLLKAKEYEEKAGMFRGFHEQLTGRLGSLKLERGALERKLSEVSGSVE